MTLTKDEIEKIFEKRLQHGRRPWWGRGFDAEMEPVFGEIDAEKSRILAELDQTGASWDECNDRIMRELDGRIASGVERFVLPEIQKDNLSLTQMLSRFDELGVRIRIPAAMADVPREGQWSEADVVVAAQETGDEPDELVVVTQFSGAVSWLMNELRVAGEGYLDVRNKYEFFGEVARAMKAFIAEHGESEESLTPLLLCGVEKAREVVSNAVARQRNWIQDLSDECRIRRGEML